MIKNLGAQVFTARDLMKDEKSIADVFGKIRKMGYNAIQPAGYCDISVTDYAKLAKDAGLSICGTICGFSTILENPEKTMEEHSILGTHTIGIGCLPVEARTDADELKKFIEDVNRLCEIYATNGFKLSYHNHSFDFRKIDGECIFDVLVRDFDRKIDFIPDTYWIQHGGGDVCSWIEKLAGRIDNLHLKDMIMEDTQIFAEVGNGNMDFDRIIATAEKCGVEHYIVEQDICSGDPLDSLRMSIDYLKKYMGGAI